MKKAQELAAMIFSFCNSNEKFIKDPSFKDQMKRAVFSISNNIAERFKYNDNNDLYRFLRISKGSCGEVRNCLLFSVKIQYASLKEIVLQPEFSGNLGKPIGGMMKYLKKHKLQRGQANNKQPNP